MTKQEYDRNPWAWIKLPEPDGKKRLTAIIGGCIPASYSLFHKLDELTAGYDEVTIYAFHEPNPNRAESRLFGCLAAWCRKTDNKLESTTIEECRNITGWMRFMGTDTEKAAIALYGNGYSNTLDIVRDFGSSEDIAYKEINGSFAA